MAFVAHYYNRYGTPLTHDIAKRMATVYDIQGNVIPFQNAIPECKIGHVHGKRSLSSSSTSPRPADKKSKSFVSPNRFEVLQSDDESSEFAFSHLVNILQYVRLGIKQILSKMQPVPNLFTSKILPTSRCSKIN